MFFLVLLLSTDFVSSELSRTLQHTQIPRQGKSQPWSRRSTDVQHVAMSTGCAGGHPSQSLEYGHKENRQVSSIIHSMYPFCQYITVCEDMRCRRHVILTSHNAWIRRVRDVRAYMVNMREVVVYRRGDREGRRGTLLLIGVRWRRELLHYASMVSCLYTRTLCTRVSLSRSQALHHL